MASLGLDGPYSLTNQEVDARVTRTNAGNYALGRVNDKGTFIVRYVGRSDSDLNTRLKQWVGKGYTMFKARYATSPKAAFEKECHNFHDFGGTTKLDNDIHPDRPNGSGWKCPACNLFA